MPRVGRKGGLQRINEVLEILQPYLIDRVKSDTPVRLPTGTDDLPSFAKREAAFLLRRRAEQMLDEGGRIENPTNRVIERGKSKAFQAVADLLEALNIDVGEEVEREKNAEFSDDVDDDDNQDDYIDVDDRYRTRERNPRQRNNRKQPRMNRRG